MWLRIGKAIQKRLDDLLLWCEQNAQGIGELDVENEDREDIKNNPLSKIVFLDDDAELRDITHIFIKTPFVYTMGGITAKDYKIAIKLLKWYGYKPKEWLELIISMTNIWIGNIKKR